MGLVTTSRLSATLVVAAAPFCIADIAAAQVSVTPSAPALRVVCVGTTGQLTFDGNSNSVCAGAQTAITGISISGGTGYTASGTAGVNVTGTGGVSTASGNISTASGNITATAGTVRGVTITDGTATLTGGNLSGVGTLSATTGTIGTLNSTTGTITTLNSTTVNGTTVNSTSIVNSGVVTSNSVSIGTGGIAIAAGAPINAGGNRVQNVAAPVADTDAANKAYVDAQLGGNTAQITGQINEAFKQIDRNTEGIAIAIALGGLALPHNANFAVSANLGIFEDKQALAFQSAIRLGGGVVLNGGIGVGIDSSLVGGRIGVMAAW